MNTSVTSDAVSDTQTVGPQEPWQAAFLQLLPEIERQLEFSFRSLTREEREEAVQESTCLACQAYHRLALTGRTHVASAATLAHYAAAGYRVGRTLGSRLNINDVCSRHCQLRKGVKVEQLGDAGSGAWQEALVEDYTVTPADLAASRIDYPAFLSRLNQRDRCVAETLAMRESTGRTAKAFGLSVGRVSQLRKELYQAWQEFHGTIDGDCSAS